MMVQFEEKKGKQWTQERNETRHEPERVEKFSQIILEDFIERIEHAFLIRSAVGVPCS